MKTLNISLLLGVLPLTLSGCPSPCINNLPLYNFPAEAHFSPGHDSIQVGDTLYLISEIPKNLKPIGSPDFVDYSNANIRGSLSVIELEPKSQFGRDAVFDFDYKSANGQIYNVRDIPRPDGFQQFLYQELADSYKLKIALIAKKKGIYGLGIPTVASSGKSDSNGCDKAYFEMNVSNADIHEHYLKGFTGSLVTPRPSNVYYFKVY